MWRCSMFVVLSSVGDYIPDTAPTVGQNSSWKQKTHFIQMAIMSSIGELLYRLLAAITRNWTRRKRNDNRGGWKLIRKIKVSGQEIPDTASQCCLYLGGESTAVDPVEVNVRNKLLLNVVIVNPDGSIGVCPIYSPDATMGCKYSLDIWPDGSLRSPSGMFGTLSEKLVNCCRCTQPKTCARSKLTGGGKGRLCHGKAQTEDNSAAALAAVSCSGKSLFNFNLPPIRRKFNFGGIEGSICNWASENTQK